LLDWQQVPIRKGGFAPLEWVRTRGQSEVLLAVIFGDPLETTFTGTGI